MEPGFYIVKDTAIMGGKITVAEYLFDSEGDDGEEIYGWSFIGRGNRWDDPSEIICKIDLRDAIENSNKG